MSAQSRAFFVQESLKLAHSLPLPDCRNYLRGMLEMIGQCDEAHDIRSAAIHLDESSRQLELIISKPQPKL